MFADIVTLAYPDPNNEYRLSTDASNLSMGAWLMQHIHEVEGKEIEKSTYFLSYKLSDTQTK